MCDFSLIKCAILDNFSLSWTPLGLVYATENNLEQNKPFDVIQLKFNIPSADYINGFDWIWLSKLGIHVESDSIYKVPKLHTVPSI